MTRDVRGPYGAQGLPLQMNEPRRPVVRDDVGLPDEDPRADPHQQGVIRGNLDLYYPNHPVPDPYPRRGTGNDTVGRILSWDVEDGLQEPRESARRYPNPLQRVPLPVLRVAHQRHPVSPCRPTLVHSYPPGTEETTTRREVGGTSSKDRRYREGF